MDMQVCFSVHISVKAYKPSFIHLNCEIKLIKLFYSVLFEATVKTYIYRLDLYPTRLLCSQIPHFRFIIILIRDCFCWIWWCLCRLCFKCFKIVFHLHLHLQMTFKKNPVTIDLTLLGNMLEMWHFIVIARLIIHSTPIAISVSLKNLSHTFSSNTFSFSLQLSYFLSFKMLLGFFSDSA